MTTTPPWWRTASGALAAAMVVIALVSAGALVDRSMTETSDAVFVEVRPETIRELEWRNGPVDREVVRVVWVDEDGVEGSHVVDSFDPIRPGLPITVARSRLTGGVRSIDGPGGTIASSPLASGAGRALIISLGAGVAASADLWRRRRGRAAEEPGA